MTGNPFPFDVASLRLAYSSSQPLGDPTYTALQQWLIEVYLDDENTTATSPWPGCTPR